MPRRYPSLRTFRAAHISNELGALWRGDECCICLDRYDETTHRPVGITSNRECNHVFGRRCLEAYLDSASPSRHTCPVCRRKWYSRRPTDPPTTRDTNTSHVLSAPTAPGASVREDADLRNLFRTPIHIDTHIDRAVEELINSMEAIEALERRDTIRLEQNLRVQLQQVQGRIHAFISRHISASDISSNHIPRGRTRTAGYRTAGNSTSQHESPAVAGLDNVPHPHPLSSAAFQASTVSLPELHSPVQRYAQSPNTSISATLPPADYFRESGAVNRRSSQFGGTTILSTPTAGPHTEATFQLAYTSNTTLSQPTSRVRQEVNAGDLRDHLRIVRHSHSRDISISASRQRNTSHISLPNIAESESDNPSPASARTSATQTPVTNRPLEHLHQHPVQAHAHLNEHAPILYPRFQTSFLHRARSTQGSSRRTEPVNTQQTPILTSSMTERGVSLRSRAAVTRPTRGLSRIMSISNLRGMITSNRSR